MFSSGNSCQTKANYTYTSPNNLVKVYQPPPHNINAGMYGYNKGGNKILSQKCYKYR